MSKAAELAALIGSQTALSNRNLIINGAMQVAQRGTSVSSFTGGTAYRTVDRFSYCKFKWNFYAFSKSTAPEGFANSLKIDCTTADASPNDFLIETILRGKTFNNSKRVHLTQKV